MNERKIGPKWQITIPAEIRKKLGVQTGDRILFTKVEGGYAMTKLDCAGLIEESAPSNSLPSAPDSSK